MIFIFCPCASVSVRGPKAFNSFVFFSGFRGKSFIFSFFRVLPWIPWQKISLVPNFDPLSLHKGLSLGNGMLAEVEDGGRQYRIGATLGHAIGQVLQLTHTT